jgi:hypothetical protein
MAVAVTHNGTLGPCDAAAEFTSTLDFILNALARLRPEPTPSK